MTKALPLLGGRSLDLFVVAGLSALAVAVTIVGEVTAADLAPVRAALAVPLVLLFPGYALTAASFPGGSGPRLGTAERAVLTLGLSLAAAAAGGLVLAQTPWRLRAGPWAVLLGGIVLAASAVALARRSNVPGAGPDTGDNGPKTNDESAPHRPVRPSPAVLRPTLQALVLALAGLVAVGALVIAARGAVAQQRAATFTQLWLVPARGAQHAPGAGPNDVRLGLRSLEARTTTYRLELLVGGVTMREWPAIELDPGEDWAATLPLPPVAAGAGEADRTGAVEAVVYRAEAPGTPYRRVTLRRVVGGG
jgi:uncharacterized membrane protein